MAQVVQSFTNRPLNAQFRVVCGRLFRWGMVVGPQTPETHDSDALRGRKVGGYRLDAVLGEGATGAVYLGRRLETTPPLVERTGLAPLALPEEAAIKLLLPPMRLSATMQTELRGRFLREAAMLQRLRHPHIVPVLRYGEDEASGLLYMVLPLLPGGTLGELLARQGGLLPDAQIAGILDDLAAALDEAHAQGVVHRDIKPANILLDEQGHAALSDFSIVRLLSEAATKLTATGQIIGTPEYMAPEQAQDHAVEGAADIYSLGVVLYRLVTGQLPFQADSFVRLAMQHVQQEPPPPRVLRPDLPEPAQAAILKALAKRPEQRFATAGALARAFREGLAGQWTPELTDFVALPPFRTPPTVSGQAAPLPLRERPRGRPLRIIAAAVLAAVLVIGTLAAGAHFVLGRPGATPSPLVLATHTPFPPTVTVGPGTPTPTPRPGQPTPTLAPGQPIPPTTPPGQPTSTAVPAAGPTATAAPPAAIYGDGSDGPLTIASNLTDSPTDATCSGSAGSTSLSFANASRPFAISFAGKPVLIHQSQGNGAGTWMRNKIVSAPGTLSGTLILESPLDTVYSAGCQVIVLRQYTNVTVNSGATWTAKAWNGATGGILAFLANGTLTFAGTISAKGKGFRGAGDGISSTPHVAVQGESYLGAGTDSNSANGTGGGGAFASGNASPGAGGGGGSYATVGNSGGTQPGLAAGQGASMIIGSSDLTTAVFGGGGGSGGATNSEGSNVSGNGGGFIFVVATAITQSGSGQITANGDNGLPQTNAGGVGGGAGGSILLKAQIATVGPGVITALGGQGGVSTNGGNGGNGGDGRVFVG